MPNEHFCSLTITGSEADVASCLELLGDPGAESGDDRLLKFERIAPTPAGLPDRCEAQPGVGCQVGHERDADCWHWNHWGTGLPCDVEITHGWGTWVNIRFWTPWTPPIPLVETLSRLQPRVVLDFVHADPATGSAGHCQYRNGGCQFVGAEFATWQNIVMGTPLAYLLEDETGSENSTEPKIPESSDLDYFVFLDDRESWSGLEGCSIVALRPSNKRAWGALDAEDFDTLFEMADAVFPVTAPAA